MKAINPAGNQVAFYICDDANKEAKFVTSKILEIKKLNQIKWGDFAILYRSNANQKTSGILEKSLKICKIPFTLTNGKDFYSKKPIGDLLCFLRSEISKKIFNFLLTQKKNSCKSFRQSFFFESFSLCQEGWRQSSRDVCKSERWLGKITLWISCCSFQLWSGRFWTFQTQ